MPQCCNRRRRRAATQSCRADLTRIEPNRKSGELAILHPGSGDPPGAGGLPGSGFVAAAFGDALYFRTYGERFASSFFNHGGEGNALFIGIVNPDPASAELAAELARRHPALTVAATRHDGPLLPEYCATARFLFAETLLEMFRAPLILFDIDSCFPPGCAGVLKIVGQSPLSYVQTRDIWPHLMISAAVVGAHPGADASSFFGHAAHYIAAKSKETGPLWAFDQVALYQAAALRRDKREIVNINAILPERHRLPGLITTDHVLPLEERRLSRSNEGMVLAGLDDSLKPVYSRRDPSEPPVTGWLAAAR